MFDAMTKVWAGERRGERWAGWFGSAAFHAMLIGAAVMTGRGGVETPVVRHHVVLPPYEPPLDHAVPVLRVLTLPGQGAWNVRLPEITVPEIPPVLNVYGALTELSRLRAMSLEGVGVTPLPGAPAVEALLDDPPEVLATPPVRYPPLLREAGIEGSVLLEFVVDTLGRAEPATIRIISSANQAFEAPAREAIVKSAYRPGRWRGQAVRALALERVAFTIQR